MIKKLSFKTSPDCNIYYGSDTHFGHDKDFIWGKRGFKSKEDHDEGVLSGINDRVGENDILVHAGDFCLNTSEERFEELLSLIRCKTVYLLWGNHNNPLERIYRREVSKMLGFEGTEIYPFRYKNLVFVGNYLEMNVNGQEIVLCHYPIKEFNKMKHETWMLCGHSHGGNPLTQIDNLNGKYLDLGWELHGKPLSFSEVQSIMSKKVVKKISHH